MTAGQLLYAAERRTDIMNGKPPLPARTIYIVSEIRLFKSVT
jgi:hypothetical protein